MPILKSSAKTRTTKRRLVRNLYRERQIKKAKTVRERYDTINSFCEFIIKVYKKFNPYLLPDPDKNFVKKELIAAFDGPLFMRDGRPDLYIVNHRSYELNKWNNDAGNHGRQIYRSDEAVMEVDGTEVRHRYLRPVRGKDAVRQIDERLNREAEGIDTTRIRVAGCEDTSFVDRSLDELDAEIEARQRDADNRRRRGGGSMGRRKAGGGS